MISKPAHEKTLHGYIEKYLAYRAEVHAFEQSRKDVPTFTREIVERVARMRDLIVESDGTRTQMTLFHPDLNGQDRIVWMSSEPEPSLVPLRLIIGWLAYSELHPLCVEDSADDAANISFETMVSYKRYCTHLHINEQTKAHEDEHLTVSFLFNAEFGKPLDMQSEDIKTIVQQYRGKLATLKQRWLVSQPCLQLRKILLWKADTTRQIKKIVCFGSGDLDKSLNSAHQHLAAFAIADTLDSFYLARNPKTPPIQIVAQTPEYDPIGHLLYRELDERPITFVNDPDGQLAIDEHTLVMSVFLPTDFPLLRIVVDMFHDNPAKRPAGFLCDLIEPDASKWCYNMSNLSSLKVKRMP